MSTPRPRWEDDDRGRGIASAAPYAAAARTLFDSMHLPDWVAEDAHLHLLPGLEAVLANG